jgi:prepilin-type N-terminal cleavage/methylation domain-containing protein
MKQHGFTLVELLVVIAIIGLLSTIAVVSLGSARSKARDTKRIADIKQITTAMQMYYDTNGGYPNTATCPSAATGYYCLGHGNSGTCFGTSNLSGCTTLDTTLSSYIAKIPDDPENAVGYFGDSYIYRYSGSDSGVNAPFLYWGMDQQTNANVCMGGAFGQWNASGRNRWWCIIALPN